MSFPGIMQGDKGNIKVNLGIISVWQLTRFYHGISVFCLYTNTALYNIPIGFIIFAILICISEMTHLQGLHIVVLSFQ